MGKTTLTPFRLTLVFGSAPRTKRSCSGARFAWGSAGAVRSRDSRVALRLFSISSSTLQCSTIRSVNDLRHCRSILASRDRYPSAMTSGMTVPRGKDRTSASFGAEKPSIGQESIPLAAAREHERLRCKGGVASRPRPVAQVPHWKQREAGLEESGKRREGSPDRPRADVQDAKHLPSLLPMVILRRLRQVRRCVDIG